MRLDSFRDGCLAPDKINDKCAPEHPTLSAKSCRLFPSRKEVKAAAPMEIRCSDASITTIFTSCKVFGQAKNFAFCKWT